MTTTTRKPKMGVAAVLRVSCTARSVSWGSYSCYRLACSWPGALHSTARYLAGASIAGGTLAYLFVDSHSSSMAPKESCTGTHGALLAGLGGVIILLVFFETWPGLISGRPSPLSRSRKSRADGRI
ncbi:hypothetical protein EDB85DRAFT_2048650 [Lactarius pseudohatsudake]|nr:hypothetical protein EDB85DRAFT_2048650 [Lactarius pseudohatsudake]